MEIPETWEKALKFTEIVRARVKALSTVMDTPVPYVLLSESVDRMNGTIVRKGTMTVHKPSIILPPHLPQFDGFELDQEGRFNEEAVTNFFLVRGITFPSYQYHNQMVSKQFYEDKLAHAIHHHKDFLQQKEDVHTGLIVAPDDCWQFSLLIFACTQIVRDANTDIQKLLDEYRKNQN